jgi:hypothetical protein
MGPGLVVQTAWSLLFSHTQRKSETLVNTSLRTSRSQSVQKLHAELGWILPLQKPR